MNTHALQALRQLGADGPTFSEGHRPLTPVRWSQDLERVLRLPIERGCDHDKYEDILAYELTKPGAALDLWPIQRKALRQAFLHEGLFAPIAVGGGKCLGLGTPVLRYDGRAVPVEQVRPGDRLMGPDSQPRTVLSTCRGTDPLYKIVPVKGAPWVCNGAHILALKHTVTGRVVEVSVEDYLRLKKHVRQDLKQFATGVDFAPGEPLPIDPYFLGVWFGDGSKQLTKHGLTGVAITKPDIEIAQLCELTAQQYDCRVRTSAYSERCPTYHIVGQRYGSNQLLPEMRRLLGAKLRVPHSYITASRRDRAAFLAGWLDTDGSLRSHGGYDFAQKRKDYAEAVCFLARSLGLRALMRPKTVKGQIYYRVSISGDCSFLPLRIPRKQAGPRRQKKDVLRTGFSVVPLGHGPYAGFELDGDGLFLLGDFTVTHNTLIASLLPTVIECKRPVIMTMPGLLRQGMAMMEDYRKSFHVRDDLTWIPYSTLSAKGSSGLLDELQPDLIVADEAHTLTGDSTRAKRFARYLKDHPETRCCFLSGTMAQRSIMDFAKLLKWALGERSPLPLHYPDLKEWAEALDVPGPDDRVRPAGELARLCRTGEPVREAWQRRLRATPGVVASSSNTSTAARLDIVGVEPPRPTEMQEALRHLHANWETPDGLELMWAMDLSRVSRQLRLGGYYREVWAEGIDPEHVKLWKIARQNVTRFVREVLKRPRPGLDSPGLVLDSLRALNDEPGGAKHRWPVPELRVWDCLKKEGVKPRSEWVWLTDEITLWAASKARQSPRVVFTDVTAVGQAVAKAAGAPYYGAGEKAAQGILQEDGTRSIVASIQAHGTGRNLQKFSDALVLGGIPNGKTWEQLLGRLHRAGQAASVVTYEVAFEDEVERAREDARFVEQILGNEQKLMGGER